MSKLLRLKQWLTIGETATRLSLSAAEEVTEADVLRLALDGHLTLSIHFVNHASGRPARIEPFGSQHISNAPLLFECGPPRYARVDGELLPNNKEVLIYEPYDEGPTTLEGVWDLMMVGAEELDVEHAYQRLTGGPEVDLICLGGPLVVNADRTEVFQLLESFKRNTRVAETSTPVVKVEVSKKTREALDRLNEMIGPFVKNTSNKDESPEEYPPRYDYETIYYPADGLPDDSVFVVRTSALRELEEKLHDSQPEKPLHSSERKSASQIIAALAEIAGVNLAAPYAADEVLRLAAATAGLELPSSPETVVKFLKAAAELKDKK